MIKDGNHEDYTVDYVDERNFVLKDSNDAVVFTTVDNKKYTFQEIDRENIGKYMPMLKRTQLSVRVEDNQMRDSRDMITLAATLTYLHRKLRPVHIIGGLKLLGFTLPLLYLMKSWYDFEKISKDKALKKPESIIALSKVLHGASGSSVKKKGDTESSSEGSGGSESSSGGSGDSESSSEGSGGSESSSEGSGGSESSSEGSGDTQEAKDLEQVD
jgi:hypothetical protein